ncbi:helix-turn-helix domain-containing protein [Bacillus sp. 31A1R]|uniref:Helix-turn-helix domain-containing protein n=1 Tax=Robertmurraya mangrovi TaxID=3098077 RepID=A0ABU5J5I6_9BACI|nr:helix-turn-helix domain-containing protein [Bacillus sp. 31A1R]MDZ5474684.1 helix-turn-helix domain-containing protein [Bacillus sp. 31A1R]
MSKYSDQFKLKVVKEYLEDSLGYKLLAQKYEIPSKSIIERWVNSYKAFGKKGLSKKRSKEVYSVQFKLDVLNFMKQTGASYQDTAIEFKMNNRSLIASWKKTFLNEGIVGLESKPKGRPHMSGKRKANPSKQEKSMSREEQLERENELLRLEIAYLKKLKAFQENPSAYLEKHKQR